ncbi:MAG: hypothetical protein LBF77_03615, partial [Spirochaetaceae bacterium]|nr:hypothetical protein [Spirochaetaceae bacterium]
MIRRFSFYPGVLLLTILLTAGMTAGAQDFGFGDLGDFTGSTGEDGAGGGVAPFALSMSGEAGMEITGFVEEFDDPADTALDGNFRGRLGFEAEGANVKAVINLKINAPDEKYTLGLVAPDEAYLQVYFGDFELESGLRKLTWGRADSLGPLDVINPLNYTSLTNMTDYMENKIAQPLIHLSYRTGSFTKIETVLLPWFSPHRSAEQGRWAPSYPVPLASDFKIIMPELNKLAYAQAGARFTTTVGPADIGLQYFYGRMYQPSSVSALNTFNQQGELSSITLDYNRYHQIGLDWAQVIAGFNLRAEAAANITGDLEGNDGAVYNPALLWSLGFDRDLLWGINLNIQCNESIRLLNDKVSGNPSDIEAGKDITSSRITAVLSKKFLRDELEIRAAGIWGIEEEDFLIIPGVYWTIQDIQLEFSAGIFGGDESGQLGQYRPNSFVKCGIAYS